MASWIKRTSKRHKYLGTQTNRTHNRNTGQTTKSTTVGLSQGNVRRTYITTTGGKGGSKSKIRTTTRGPNGYVKTETKTLNKKPKFKKPPKPKAYKQPKAPKAKKLKKIRPPKSTTFKKRRTKYATHRGNSSFDTAILKYMFYGLIALWLWSVLGYWLLLALGTVASVWITKKWWKLVDEAYEEMEEEEKQKKIIDNSTVSD